MNPNEALDILREGNERYLNGNTHKHDFQASRIKLNKQRPIAAVLSCSDSRVVPQFVFDQDSGKLFVVRVAGNIATAYGIASLEYAVEYLSTPLIYVLGHTYCGAVDAAIKVVKNDAKFPGELPGLFTPMVRAVHITESKTGNLLTNAVQENVRLTIDHLMKSSEIIRTRAQSGKLQIVGGLYELSSGKISLVS